MEEADCTRCNTLSELPIPKKIKFHCRSIEHLAMRHLRNFQDFGTPMPIESDIDTLNVAIEETRLLLLGLIGFHPEPNRMMDDSIYILNHCQALPEFRDKP